MLYCIDGFVLYVSLQKLTKPRKWS